LGKAATEIIGVYQVQRIYMPLRLHDMPLVWGSQVCYTLWKILACSWILQSSVAVLKNKRSGCEQHFSKDFCFPICTEEMLVSIYLYTLRDHVSDVMERSRLDVGQQGMRRTVG